MASDYHINPRIRAYGKARIDVTRRAKDEIEWQKLWREPLNPFPFEFLPGWKFCVEYKVDDFAAEVGFFIDMLGFPVIAFSPSYAQFLAPEGDFCISVSSLREAEKSTPPDSIRLQFRVEDILETAEMLLKRGIVFEQKPVPVQEGSDQAAGYFRTPHGVCIDLWGEIMRKPDIHDLIEEDDDEDEGESERIIQELLELTGEDAEKPVDLTDDEADIDSDDEFPDEEDEKDEEDEEFTITSEIGDDVEQDSPKGSQGPDLYKPNRSKPDTRTSVHPLPIQRGITPSGRSINPPKPAPSSRGNGELTYQEIEDDPDTLDEDGL